MARARSSSQQTPTSESTQRRSSTPTLKRSPGSELNKNTPSSEQRQSSPPGLSAGPTMVIPVPKVPTIAPSALTTASAELSLTLTTEHACTPASRSQALTLRSCPDNGNTRLDPSRESPWATTSGFLDIFSSASLRTSTCQSPSPPSSSKTGMALAATRTSRRKRCELAPVAWTTLTR